MDYKNDPRGVSKEAIIDEKVHVFTSFRSEILPYIWVKIKINRRMTQYIG